MDFQIPDRSKMITSEVGFFFHPKHKCTYICNSTSAGGYSHPVTLCRDRRIIIYDNGNVWIKFDTCSVDNWRGEGGWCHVLYSRNNNTNPSGRCKKKKKLYYIFSPLGVIGKTNRRAYFSRYNLCPKLRDQTFKNLPVCAPENRPRNTRRLENFNFANKNACTFIKQYRHLTLSLLPRMTTASGFSFPRCRKLPYAGNV